MNSFLNSIFQGIWLILAGAMLGATCGLLFYLTQDRVYKSEARLSYQEQAGLSQPVHEEMTTLEELISAVFPKVTSRQNLERIISDLDFHSDLLGDESLEEAVEAVRENIQVVQTPSGDSLVIEYSGVDPAQVAQFANMLAESFIMQSSEYQRERSLQEITAQKNELSRVELELVEKEAEMRDYKQMHYNELPTQQPVNQVRLAALQGDYQARLQSIKEIEQRIAEVQNRIATHERLISEQEEQREQEPQDTSININQQTTLEMLQNSLAELQTKYSEQHPMVQRLQNQIVALEEIMAEQMQERNERRSLAQKTDQVSKELQSMQAQLRELSLSADELTKQNREVQAQISKYQGWIERTPIREAEWSVLIQEYTELKQQRDALARKDLQASSIINQERWRTANQFQIEDQARIATTPIKPDFVIFIIVSSIAGVICVCLLAWVVKNPGNSFKNKKALEKTLNLPVTCSVPNLPLKTEVKRRKIMASGRVAFFLIWISLFCAAVALMAREGKLVSSLL